MIPAARFPRPARARSGRAVAVAALVALGLLAGGLLGGALLWRAWTGGWEPPASVPPLQRVRLQPGTGLAVFADTLSARGLLRYPWLLRAAGRIGGRDRHLKAGLYELPAGLSPRELLRRLLVGESLPVRITIPEGAEAEEAAALVAAALEIRPERFLAVADSLARAGVARLRLVGDPGRLVRLDSLLAAAAAGGRPLHWAEGYLAPETYLFAEGTGAVEAAGLIVGLGLQRVLTAAAGRAGPAEALTPHELATLASLVEAETGVRAERPQVAAVYLNRLRRGWRLQADPTVAYSLRKRGRRLFYRDLEADTPYNTYRRPGLPPGPICNPGAAALAAAAAPAATEALFFVADGAGGHVFSRTSAEHAQAVARYRRLRAAPPAAGAAGQAASADSSGAGPR